MVTATGEGKIPHRTPFLRKYLGTLLFLALLATITYAGEILTPSLLGDEWGIIGDHIQGSAPPCPKLSITARTLEGCWMPSVIRLFGLNMRGFHAAGALVTLLSAVLLLIALDILIPDWPAYNGAVAIMFLVIPADMARLWLAGHIIFTTALFLLSVCFMALFWRDGRWWAWLAGMAAISLSLNYYESAIGVIIALSVLAFVFGRHQPRLVRLGFLAPAALAGLYAVWRWRWQTMVGTAYGHVTEDVTFAPGILLERFSFGYDYTLRKSWADVILDLLRVVPGEERLNLIAGTALLAVVVLVPVLIVYWMTRNSQRFAGLAGRPEEEGANPWDLAKAAAVGFVMLGAGYFPIVLAVFPGTSYSASRTHNLPTIGATMVICAGLFGLGLWLGRTPSRAKAIALAGLIPLLILGIASHMMVQRQIRQAWADQQLFWHSVFIQAPDFIDGTTILLLIDGYEMPSKGPRPFISGYWGITYAFQLLYGNTELNAEFAYVAPDQALDIDGDDLLLDYYGLWEYPAEATVVFVFDEATRQLTHLPQLERDGVVLPLGAGRIRETPTEATEYRRLVAGD